METKVRSSIEELEDDYSCREQEKQYYSERVNHIISLYRYQYAKMPGMIASPIEQMMCIGLRSSVSEFRFIADDNEISIYPQFKIKNYTADFLLAVAYQGEILTLIVECDGHDYHEKTKKQAQHDKKRDRELTALGYRIARFTGSEIYKDPFSCAHEVIVMLFNLSMEGFQKAEDCLMGTLVKKDEKREPIYLNGSDHPIYI